MVYSKIQNNVNESVRTTPDSTDESYKYYFKKEKQDTKYNYSVVLFLQVLRTDKTNP